MYKLVKEPRAWWPVVWNGVAEDGAIVENKIELRFVLHSEDEFARLAVDGVKLGQRAGDELAAAADADAGPEAPLSTLYAGFVRKIAVDWRGVGAENGEPLKFDEPGALEQLLNVPGVFKAAVEAYGRCRAGEKDVRRGN